MLSHRIEHWLLQIWYAGHRIPYSLRFLSKIYHGIVLFRRRWFIKHPPGPSPVAVIVVGNLTVGGTGKTPVVAALTKSLQTAGYRVAIISRGFRRSGVFFGQPKSAIKVGPHDDPYALGDEPVMLAKQTQCPVWVGRRRMDSLKAAVAEGADVVISDDGLQHWKLPRSYQICVIDGKRGFGNRQLLPAGPLREPVERLNSVDAVLVKGSMEWDWPYLSFHLLPTAFLHPASGRSLDVNALDGQTGTALCAIAHPEAFQATLETLGVRSVLKRFPDHYEFRSDDLHCPHCDGPLFLTEKDWVKIEGLNIDPGVKERIYVLIVEASLPSAFTENVILHVRGYIHEH